MPYDYILNELYKYFWTLMEQNILGTHTLHLKVFAKYDNVVAIP